MTLFDAQRSVERALEQARVARLDIGRHSAEASEAVRIAIYALGSAHALLLMEGAAWQRQPGPRSVE